MLGNKKEYSKYYGDFRGVDFSNDHTQVIDSRFAYSVNMYKDYQSGQGKCIETIPGFRRRVEGLDKKKIWGIHQINVKENGEQRKKVLIHCGNRVYPWALDDPYDSPGTVHKMSIALGEPVKTENGFMTFEEDLGAFPNDQYWVSDVLRQDGSLILDAAYHGTYNDGRITLTLESAELSKGERLQVHIYRNTISFLNDIEFPERKSTSVVFNNRLYIFCGGNSFVYDGKKVSNVTDDPYIPTTYINTITSGENADAGTQKEQRNMLSEYFYQTYYADGKTNQFFFDVNEDGAEVVEITVYGKSLQGVALKTISDGWIHFQLSFEKDGRIYYSDNQGDTWYYIEGTKKTETELDKDLCFYYVKSDEDLASTNMRSLYFVTPPPAPLDVGYPENYAGIRIKAKNQWFENDGTTPIGKSILDCTLACVYDNRVFLSGNPRHPNRVFWSALNNPSYFPVTNWEDMGVGDAPVTGMIPLPDALMVLKGDTQQDGSVYYLSPVETGDDLAPKIYTKTAGLNGTGCLGPCVNFLDDPVFISRFGLEAMGQLSVRLERAIEHRSSLVDAKLTQMDLSRASMVEWNGYLVILIDGKIFMADSRQRYADETGVMQYEWYYLEDIGIWEGQYVEYKYAESMRGDMYRYTDEGAKPRYIVKYCKACGRSSICDSKDAALSTIAGCGCAERTLNWVDLELKLSEDLAGEVANPPDENGIETEQVEFVRLKITDDDGIGDGYDVDVFYHVRKVMSQRYDEIDHYEALLCTTRENFTGGKFVPATVLAVIDHNLFFGTENGIICSFNFDMRDENGEIPKEYYSFDNRAIFCGVATKMDNCGAPHLTKNTVKKSTVIKTKTMQTSGAKIKVRTNRRPYEQIARISSGRFFFDNVDFSDFSFVTTEHNLFAVKEKEKKWVEKQYFLYSDEYRKPFSLYYIAYCYNIVGRYKEPK